VSAQPARQRIRTSRHFRIKTHPSHTAEILRRLMYRGPARVGIQRRYNSEIDGSDVIPISAIPSPRRDRVVRAAQPQSARKIIPAATRHDQHWQTKLHQWTQVPVDGAIAAKEQEDVRLIRSGGQSNPPVDFFAGAKVTLKWQEVFLRTSRPEDDSRAHVRGRE
jgi:hypothetical protein